MPGKGAIVKSYDSWNVTLMRKRRLLSIETVDYHAGPLTLTRDELADLARMMGLRVGKRKKKQQTVIGSRNL